MLTLDATAVAEALPYDQLIQALATAFGGSIEVPLRTLDESLASSYTSTFSADGRKLLGGGEMIEVY